MGACVEFRCVALRFAWEYALAMAPEMISRCIALSCFGRQCVAFHCVGWVRLVFWLASDFGSVTATVEVRKASQF